MSRLTILEKLSKESGFSQLFIDHSPEDVTFFIAQLAEEGYIRTKCLGEVKTYELTELGYQYLKSEHDFGLDASQSSGVRQAVILAAGQRSEFEKPAALLEVDGMTLLERTINILEENGIEKIVICTGFEKEAIQNFIPLKEKENIYVVENERYLWTGSMASLASAADYITDDFILLEDDILIEEKAIIELLNDHKRDCMLITKESGSGDEAFVEVNDHHLINMSKDVHQLNRIDGEMIGISKISYDVFKEMIQVFNNNKNPFLNYEYLHLAVSKTVGYLKIADIIWAEIDNAQDYFKVLDKYYPLLKRKEADFREQELKQLIASSMKLDVESISSIEPLGGLTNRNFKATINEKEYAVRIPGKGTEHYINRAAEKMNSELTSRIGINPKVLYFNENTGLKIVEFIPEAETLNPKTGKREDNLIMVAGIFRTLHLSGEEMLDRFDVFDKITEYETILEQLNGKLFEGHDEVKRQVLELEEDYKSIGVQLTPCHNDPLAENFVKSGENNMYLIDWEFSGMNDPYWDIAAYIIEAELSPAEETLFLLEYFEGHVTDENLRRLLMNKIFLDFLWTIWALMKEAGGEDFGSYALNRFLRAKENLLEYQNRHK